MCGRAPQVIPASVAPRVLLFPWPLSLPVGWEKISPGFFDAPGSLRLLFPAMREHLGADAASLRPTVTVAFSSIEGFKVGPQTLDCNQRMTLFAPSS